MLERPAFPTDKFKVKLSPEQAREIYAIKATRSMQKHPIFQRKISAAAVARHFMVTDKAVRDIWKGRTWCRETAKLRCSGDDAAMLIKRNRRAVMKKHVQQTESLFSADNTYPESHPQAIVKVEDDFMQDQHILGNMSTLNDPMIQSDCSILPVEHQNRDWSGTKSSQSTTTSSSTSKCVRNGIWQPSIPFSVPPPAFELSADISDQDPFYDDWPFWSSLNAAPKALQS
mmetsp:Transcript_10927/g.30588  ORF Transcript_10927/g.30588 Transcript_10927/m.30588 type:complete len:229 (+) Transcript_10927:69-755(+)